MPLIIDYFIIAITLATIDQRLAAIIITPLSATLIFSPLMVTFMISRHFRQPLPLGHYY